MNADCTACVRVKGGEGEQLRIDSRVRQGCIMSPWLFNVYMDEWWRRGVSFLEDGRE